MIRDKQISPKTLPGKIYVVTTILSCVTDLGIFHHGGFGAPHVLSIVANADAPALRMATGALFIVFLIGATLQVRRLRAGSRASST